MRPISFLAVAEDEADDAIAWYEEVAVGLGRQFRESIEITVDAIGRNPLSFPIVKGSNVRRAIVGRFPFIIVFVLKEDSITVVSVFHMSRNPIVWKGRID